MTQLNETFPAAQPEELPSGSAPENTAQTRPETPEPALPQEETDGSLKPSQAPEPENLDYSCLKLPQGSTVAAGVLENFKQLAQELNISPQAAQRLMDWEAQCGLQADQEAQSRREQLLQGWAQRSKEMLGPDYEEGLELAVRAAERFGGPELRELLQETGLGNHPVIVKTFCQIGRSMAEDSSLGGKEASGGDKTFAEALYGSN